MFVKKIILGYVNLLSMKPLHIEKFGKLGKPNDRGRHLLFDTKIIAANGLPSFFIIHESGV